MDPTELVQTQWRSEDDTLLSPIWGDEEKRK